MFRKAKFLVTIYLVLFDTIFINAQDAIINIALNKPTIQSDQYANCESSNAVDGNTDGNIGGRSCSISGTSQISWWAVDLMNVYEIKRVRIFRRTDCCSDRLVNFSIYATDALPNSSSSFEEMQRCFYQAEEIPESETFVCANNIIGRVVVIRLSIRQYLSLCEVQIEGMRRTYEMKDFGLITNKKISDIKSVGLSAFEKANSRCIAVDDLFLNVSSDSLMLSFISDSPFKTTNVNLTSLNIIHDVEKRDCDVKIPAFFYAITDEITPRTSRCRYEGNIVNNFNFKCDCNTTPCKKLIYYISKMAVLENPEICSILVNITDTRV